MARPWRGSTRATGGDCGGVDTGVCVVGGVEIGFWVGGTGGLRCRGWRRGVVGRGSRLWSRYHRNRGWSGGVETRACLTGTSLTGACLTGDSLTGVGGVFGDDSATLVSRGRFRCSRWCGGFGAGDCTTAGAGAAGGGVTDCVTVACFTGCRITVAKRHPRAECDRDHRDDRGGDRPRTTGRRRGRSRRRDIGSNYRSSLRGHHWRLCYGVVDGALANTVIAGSVNGAFISIVS